MNPLAAPLRNRIFVPVALALLLVLVLAPLGVTWVRADDQDRVPVSITSPRKPASLRWNNQQQYTATAKSDGKGVQRVPIKWSATGGTLSSECVNTDANGNSSVIYTANRTDGAFRVTMTQMSGTNCTGSRVSSDSQDVTIDGTAPVITLKPDGSKTWYDKTDTRGNSGLHVSVYSSDRTGDSDTEGQGAGSGDSGDEGHENGVATISCTANGSDVGHLPARGGTFELRDGVWAVACTATDTAGNTGYKNATYHVDTLVWTVTATPDRPADSNNWYNRAIAVSFSGTGANSGGVTCDAPKTYSGPASATSSVTGSCTDAVGKSISKTLTFQYDATTPTISFGTPTPAANAAGWNNSNVSVPFTTGDNLAGVAATSSTSPLILSTEGSLISGTVTVTDTAGNRAIYTSPAIKIDKTTPRTSLQLTASAVPGGVYGSAVNAILTASDGAGSGVATTQYSVNGGSAVTYTSVFTVTTRDSPSITFWSKDNAGNVETARSQTVTGRLDFPVLTSAVTNVVSGTVRVKGTIQAPPTTTLGVFLFANADCTAPDFGAARRPLGRVAVTTNSSGNGSFDQVFESSVPEATGVSATTSTGGVYFSTCRLVTTSNESWFTAQRLQFHSPATSQQYIVDALQRKWFRFPVPPGSKLTVRLTGLPGSAITLHRDPHPIYQALAGSPNAQQASADAAGSKFLPSDYLPSDFLPSDYLPSDYLPSDYLPSDFLPSDFLPSDFLPSDFLPSDFLPSDFLPSDFLPSDFLPSDFLPSDFLPSDFLPSDYLPSDFLPSDFLPSDFLPSDFLPSDYLPSDFLPSDFLPSDFLPSDFLPSDYLPSDFLPGVDSSPFQPAAYSGATARSLLAFSMYPNTPVQTIERNTYDMPEDLYVRVTGPYDASHPFTLTVTILAGACSGIAQVSGAMPTAPSIAGLKSIILTDSGRLSGTPVEIAGALNRLSALAARADVAGVVIDLKDYPRVAAANIQADANTGCPAAKNLAANEIKRIVDAYRAANSTVQYIVLAGGASVIPYSQTPDTAGLGVEKGYVPPVRASTASEAGLAWSLIQGQDYYGSSRQIALGDHAFYIPDLAVGRLVETASDISTAVNVAIATNLVITPTSALVTGYDFVADGAQAARQEIELGTGRSADSLIQATGLPPTDPSAWSAGQLRSKLLGTRHDIALLTGHFSSGRLLAADYTTSMTASEITASSAVFTNTLLMALGCHSGYTIPLPDLWLGASPDPDWAKAFLRKGAAGYVASTGYAYGDTDFVAYGERIIVNFTQELRRGSGPVAIGKALVQAKKEYMAGMAAPVGLDEKTLIEMVLYGLPMMQVNMPGQRILPPSSSSLVGSVASSQGPGAAFGLREADISVAPALTAHTVPLTNTSTNSTINTTYLSGKDGVESSPFQPVLPKELYDVSVSSNVLRGFAFRGGAYNQSSVLPLTSAPTTETSRPHTAFSSDVFFPIQPWQANYFDALGGGPTRIAALPAQLKSTTPGSTADITLRQFSSLQFRLYYLDSNWPANDTVRTAAAASAPSILSAVAQATGNTVKFQVRVPDDKTASVHAVWILYTGTDRTGPLYGRWQPLDLVRSGADASLWEAMLSSVDPADILFMVQAVNGAGLATLDTNIGAFYGVAAPAPVTPPPPPQATSLTLSGDTSGVYLSQHTFRARLLDVRSNALPGQIIIFTLGGQSANATTDITGAATVTMTLVLSPGVYGVGASFRGTADYLASYAPAGAFEVQKPATTLTMSSSTTASYGDNTGVTATLRDGAGHELRGGPSVLFQVFGVGGTYTVMSATDYSGDAQLGTVQLPAGAYTVNAAYFGDDLYAPSQQSGSLTLTNTPTSVTLVDFSAGSGLGDDSLWLAAVPVLGLVMSGVLLARRRRRSHRQNR